MKVLGLGKKRGMDNLYKNVIYLLVVIVFFSLALGFIYGASSGAMIYEQTYAKRIALMIDGAKPGMKITLSLDNIKKIVEENEKEMKDCFIIDDETNEVKVSLSDSTGFKQKFFTEYDFKVYFTKGGDKIIIQVLENE